MKRNASRMAFEAREVIINPKDDDKQDLAFTGYLEIGDTIDILDVDALGNIIGSVPTYDNVGVLAIVPNQFIALDAVIDTTGFTGTPTIRVNNIKCVQDALDRLYRRKLAGPFAFNLVEPIVAFELDTPAGGQGTYSVDNSKFFRASDKVDILSDEGLQVSDANVLSVNPLADDTNNKSTIVIDQSIDLAGLNNPIFVNKTITMQSAVERLQERVDQIDEPVRNEDMNVLNGEGDGFHTCYETSNLFLQRSTDVNLDSARPKVGTAGDRSDHSQGATNSELIFTSMILGTLGNRVQVEVLNAPGLAVTVTKAFGWTPGTLFTPSLYKVSVNSNSGAATSKEIADAINADAEARRIVQVQYGVLGDGVVAPFAAQFLTGGDDNGTKDYAEIEQVFKNVITATGRKFISFHIRPNDPLNNRMVEPPQQDEEIFIDYAKIMVNK